MEEVDISAAETLRLFASSRYSIPRKPPQALTSTPVFLVISSTNNVLAHFSEPILTKKYKQNGSPGEIRTLVEGDNA